MIAHTPALVIAAVAAMAIVPVAVLAGANPPAAQSDTDARSAALFVEMGKVIQSPRCLNCHPRTDSPTQGDAMVVHNPPVTRPTPVDRTHWSPASSRSRRPLTWTRRSSWPGTTP